MNQKMTKIRGANLSKIAIIIAIVLLLGVVAAAVNAQGRGAIVSISRLGQGTATNPPRWVSLQ